MDKIDDIRSRLKLRDFQIILAISEARTLRAAAGALGVTQPALTYALRGIEDTVGAALFERATDGMHLTPTGTEFLVFARKMLAFAEVGLRDLDVFSNGLRGDLRLAFTPTTTVANLPEILLAFQREAPDVQISVVARPSHTHLEALRSGEIDIAVGPIGPEFQSDDLATHIVSREAISVMASPNHPLATKSKVGLQDMARFGWIYPVDPFPSADDIRQVFIDGGVAPPRVGFQSSSTMINRDILRQTDLLGISPEGLGRTSSSRDFLTVLERSFGNITIEIGATTLRRETSNPVVDLMMSIIENRALSGNNGGVMT